MLTIFSAVATALFAAVLSAYVSTLFPSIPGGDSGELVAEACHLGVAHPPGYPLFVLLGHLAIKFPLPADFAASITPAYRVNFMNALFGAGAAVLLYRSVMLAARLLNRRNVNNDDCLWRPPAVAAGIIAAACYAFGPLQWLYSVGAEVFALNNFASSLLVWLLLRYADDPSHKNVLLGAFVCGLAMTNQHTIVLFEIPIILWILFTRFKILTVKAVLQYAGVFFAGMLPYAFLPISDTFFPQPLSWGDCSTLQGFIRHFVRADYGTFRLYAQNVESAGLLERLRLYGENFATLQVPPVIAVNVVFGIVVLVGAWFTGLFKKAAVGKKSEQKPKPPVSTKSPPAAPDTPAVTSISPVSTSSWPLCLLFVWSFYLLVFHYLSNMPLDQELLYGVHARFWQQPNVLSCLFVGVGVWKLAFLPISRMTESQFQQHRKTLWAVCLVVAASIAVYLEHRSHAVSDQSQNWHLTKYAKSLLVSVPPNSMLITSYDQQWTTVRYLHECEDYRPDVDVFNAPMMSFEWFERHRQLFPRMRFPGTFMQSEAQSRGTKAFSLVQLIDANIDNENLPGGLYWAGTLTHGREPEFSKRYDLRQRGMVMQFIDLKDKEMSLQDVLEQEQVWNDVVATITPLPNITVYNMETWEWTVHEDFWAQAEQVGTLLLEWATTHSAPDGSLNATMVLQAAGMLEGALAHKTAPSTSALYKNLGLAHVKLVQDKSKWPDMPLPRIPGLPENATLTEWRDRSSHRVMELWEHFLTMPGASEDPSYSAIVDVVNTLRKVLGKPEVQAGKTQTAQQARKPATKQAKAKTTTKKS